jgi:hypothetical protein
MINDIKKIVNIGDAFSYKTLIKLIAAGHKVSYAVLNNYPELNYHIDDKIGVSVLNGIVTDIYGLYTITGALKNE